MYTPPFNLQDNEEELRAFVADVRAGWLVTNGQAAAPSATFLPVIWRDNTVIAHFAKANPHWREIGARDSGAHHRHGPRCLRVPHVVRRKG